MIDRPLPGDEPSVVFVDLEPRLYTVIASSLQRGLRVPAPALHVLAGQATHYWLQPQDRVLDGMSRLADEPAPRSNRDSG